MGDFQKQTVALPECNRGERHRPWRASVGTLQLGLAWNLSSWILVVSHGCDVSSLNSFTLVSQSCCPIAPVLVVVYLWYKWFRSPANMKCLGLNAQWLFNHHPLLPLTCSLLQSSMVVCQFHDFFLVESGEFHSVSGQIISNSSLESTCLLI